MIKFLITGGTIDGLGIAPEGKHKSLIPRMLMKGKIPKKNYRFEILMLKDSRLITNKDRELIFQKCLKAKEKQIVVTHGTYTMVETAKYLGRRHLDKTIVITGSLIFGDKKTSDALFNLGGAVSAVQLLPRGVYIIMNGIIFSWDKVKHLSKGGFGS